MPLAEAIVKKVAASYFDSATNTALKVEESMHENRAHVSLAKTYTTSVVQEIREHSSAFIECAADHRRLEERLSAAVSSLESTKKSLDSTAAGLVGAVEKALQTLAGREEELLKEQEKVTKLQSDLTAMVKDAEGVVGPTSFKTVRNIATWLVRQHSFMMKFVTTLCTCPRACDAADVACRGPVLKDEVSSILAHLPPHLRGETSADSADQQQQAELLKQLEAVTNACSVPLTPLSSFYPSICIPHGKKRPATTNPVDPSATTNPVDPPATPNPVEEQQQGLGDGDEMNNKKARRGGRPPRPSRQEQQRKRRHDRSNQGEEHQGEDKAPSGDDAPSVRNRSESGRRSSLTDSGGRGIGKGAMKRGRGKGAAKATAYRDKIQKGLDKAFPAASAKRPSARREDSGSGYGSPDDSVRG